MGNLSKQKRDQMIEFLEHLKKQHKDDDKSLAVLNEIQNKLNEKKYGLVWEEHSEQVDEEMKTKIPVFTLDSSKTIKLSDSSDCNFLLEGDNLHSLTLLEKTHKGKIDVIYIDPPYNTGHNDFAYDDNFLNEEDSFRHSKWLSFMQRRLRIARKVLSNNGLIFISIDDNEVNQLKLLCDEIFGEQNFVSTIIWKSKSGGANDSSLLATDHEYVLVYSKNYKFAKINNDMFATVTTSYNKEDEKGKYSLDRLDKQSLGYHETLDFPIIGPDGKEYKVIHKNPKKPQARWRWGKDTVAERYNELVFIWPYVYTKNYQKTDGQKPRTLLVDERFGRTRTGSTNLKNCIGPQKIFNYPKPISLIKYLLSISTNKTSTILDFFAGSGTTGQAVSELNKEDGGNRKFILCTNNENSICESVTYPRIKTVITGKRPDDSTYSEGIKSNLLYYKTDFISKQSDELSQQLNEHIKEMIQLEIGKIITNEEYPIILSDDEADELESNVAKYKDIKNIYIANDVMLTAKQKKLFGKYEIKIIPDNYFEFELREQGEIF